MVISLRARDVSPFILDGMRAFAVGGFSGNDPIFDEKSFNRFIENYKYAFFLLGDSRPIFRPRGSAGDPVRASAQNKWKDISNEVNFPRGTLFVNR